MVCLETNINAALVLCLEGLASKTKTKFKISMGFNLFCAVGDMKMVEGSLEEPVQLDCSSIPPAPKQLASSSNSVKLHSRVPACGPLLHVWVSFLSCRDTHVCV